MGRRRRRWRRWRATVALLPLDRLWEEDMRKHNNGRSGVNVKVKNSMAVPMREATRTLLRELMACILARGRVLWLLLA